MENNAKRTILEYSITFAACLVVAFLASVLQGLFKPFEQVVEITNWNITSERQKVFFVLCNGFFISIHKIMAVSIDSIYMNGQTSTNGTMVLTS